MTRVFVNIVILLGFICACYGYLANFYKLFTEQEGIGKVAARVIGVVAFPLGCIIGWF